jgi:hypothetical protein
MKEVKQDLFSVDKKYYLAHCISADINCGAGIAKEFQKRFHIRESILDSQQTPSVGSCILTGRVFNLITKSRYFHKPTYYDFISAVCKMRALVEEKNVYYLAMPKIGCGLDRLKWEKVSRILGKTFQYTDVKILICTI